jgi:hypothetical protein
MVNESSAARSPGSSFQNPQATSPNNPESRKRSVNSRVGRLEVALTLDPWASTSSAESGLGANGDFIVANIVMSGKAEVKPARMALSHSRPSGLMNACFFWLHPFRQRPSSPTRG